MLLHHSACVAHVVTPSTCAYPLARPFASQVFFLDETFEDLAYDATTTVSEAVEQIASIIKLQNFSTFTLFESRKAIKKDDKNPQVSTWSNASA